MNALQQMHSPRVRGFALMMAVFMIVTLAAIAVYLLTISTGQLEAATQDEQGARASQAARSGIDWGAYQLLRNTGNCPAFQRLTFAQPGLLGFHAEVVCAIEAAETEGAVSVDAHRITVTGCNRNPCGTANTDPTYVERQLMLVVTREF